MSLMVRGPSLYDFLFEAELSHYFTPLKNDLKVTTVAQLKYVEEDDLAQLGMTKPEQRRLRKYFQKYSSRQTYLRKIKKMILPKNKDDPDRTSLYLIENSTEKSNIKVPSKHIIPKENIVINKELGVGEFGVVQQGVWTNEDGERIQVAIKCLSEERMQKNHMEFLKEAAIMHTIDHENIVRLYGVVLETNTLMLVTELAPLRSLLECLKEPALRPSFPVISLCDFALQICDGMQYLENKKLIHRDLAARNILVFAKNKVKISDFGLSRALGVGKDYYQTNFNVNLKLPIAWCAPECINYLRFTSASDVWAYGVTLWEMFSYGFQPWAALTGQQILEAIDEPNFQRLEQPECCPKEYYTLMLKCWQHDANKRPKFSDIYVLLPECKPEQVQAVHDTIELLNGPKPKKDWLHYQTGEIITVLDKRPLPDNTNLWKGILTNGKTGLFNPAHTVAYLGQNLPTTRPSFSRADSKSGIYASRRRLRTDMISHPQGDFKHTGHVGLDGAFFGDISFLGDKYHQLPKQIVTPYKPQDDKENVSPTLTTLSSDSSDKIPLLKKFSNSDGRNGSSSDNWSDVAEQTGTSVISHCINDGSSKRSSKDGEKLINMLDHEYHEISDDDDFGFIENSKFESLDFGPSFMDEVFKALGNTQTEIELEEQPPNESNEVQIEIKELATKVTREGSKKKQAMVKPISAADQQTIDSAIEIAKKLASKSFSDLENQPENVDNEPALESPKTPSSPFKQKFSFKFKTSPKTDRRNFSEETEAISDIQDIITEEAKEAYNSLVQKGHGLERSVSLPPKSSENNLPRSRQPLQISNTTDSSDPESENVDSNPLRMLRSGVPVRPKVRGNRHGIPNSGRAATPHTATVARLAANAASNNSTALVNGTRSSLGSPPPPPQAPKTFPRPNITSRYSKDSTASNTSSKSDETSSDIKLEDQSDTSSTNTNVSCSESSNDAFPNPLPLPPRDRTKPLPVLKHHQRKHPLILPGVNSSSLMDNARNLTKQVSCPDVPSQSLLSPSEPPERRASEGAPPSNDISLLDTVNANNSSLFGCAPNSLTNSISAPPKPARSYTIEDSYETEIQAEIDSLDNIPEEESQPMYKGGDHVSCEDLLEFALDKPNARRTQGRARGVDSDEVRIMQKVLAKEQVTPEECLSALNETDWDMHNAIKYMRLHCILTSHMIPLKNLKQTLVKCNWDVRQAANYLLATHNVNEDTTEV